MKNKRSNASPILKKLIPPKSVVDSFLFFSGEAEFELLKYNVFLVAHTTSYGVYEFWRCMQTDPKRIASIAEYFSKMFKDDTKMFYYTQDKWMEYKDPFVRAAIFYLLSFYSDSGRVSSGAHTSKGDQALQFALSRIRTFEPKHFHMKFDQGEDFLSGAAQVVAPDYLFFPMGDYSYNYFEEGVGIGFEDTRVYHKKVKKFTDLTDHKCVLTYAKHSQVFKLYKDYNMTMINEYGRIVENKKDCREIIIANF